MFTKRCGELGGRRTLGRVTLSSVLVATAVFIGALRSNEARAELMIAKDGKALVAVWHAGDAADAAKELAGYIERIGGAKVEVRATGKDQKPGEAEPAIVVGALALESGLPAPPKTISGDGYRILLKGNRLLMAGETAESTFFAASHFLETLGCRWFFDNPLGEVVPTLKTIAVDKLDVAEQPDFASRSIWGPNWRGREWQRHNRLGGMALPTGHDWQHVPAEQYGKEHPEYYALRGGARKPGGWLCTSNPDVRRLFAEALVRTVQGKGRLGVSLSPPDGTGYCECEKCVAQDVPGYLEPSSGRVAISDRYQNFYNAIAAEVLKTSPNAILNFYAYADYSVPPKQVKDAPPNLCAWVAPIRFCRMHSLSNPLCESRGRCRGVVDGWAEAVSKIGWREYNYVLAEATVPFAKFSVWKDDIPYLKKKGCLGLNIECLAFWHLYGPHTYLIARLAWKADADVDAIMDDFYTQFCGKAAPNVKAYWERIDKAYRETNAHAGSFYSVHAVWTRDLATACEADLDAALKAADDETIRKRVEMFRMGLQNATYYLALREATNRCDFAKAKETYDKWLAHMDAINAAKIHPVGEYKHGYAPRFLGSTVEEGLARVTGERKLVLQLPDEWLFRYDPKDEGEAAGWARPDATGAAGAAPAVAAGWRTVKTYSATLNEQKVPEELTWMWYRTKFAVPADVPAGPLHLWFAEVDGRTMKVFLNGEVVGECEGARKAHEVAVTGKLLPGKENTVAVKIDHSRISELMLGGIIKPVMIYAGPKPPQPPPPEPKKPKAK